MCSWCYGFAPTLAAVRGELRPGLELGLVAGGLAPDSTRPMDADTRRYVQAAWRAVTERTGVEFDHSFWELAEPRRSTYPACRALLAARREGLGWELLAGIQRAYYREARNPSDVTTLVELAVELGLDGPSFAAALGSAELEAELQADLTRARAAGATSFPSLIYEGRLVASGCLAAEPLRAALDAAGLLGSEPY
jgi:putative protein-disulfide isomerase